MVDVNVNDSQNENIVISVGSDSSGVNLDVTGDKYYTDLAKQWAIEMRGKVQGVDYSSKYYAQESKQYAEQSEGAAEQVLAAITQGTADAIIQATTTINQLASSELELINEAGSSQIESIVSVSENYITEMATLKDDAQTSAESSEQQALLSKQYADEAKSIIEEGVTPATTSKLGGIIVGDNLSVDENGRLSADAQQINIDNTTITKNANDELQAVAVIDNNAGNALKTWTGTIAQYDALETKDSNTLYNITDDANAPLTILELLYPVGAIYIGTMSVCPLQVLGVGTWELRAKDRVLQGAGERGEVGSTLEAGLPNITGTFTIAGYSDNTTSLIYNVSGMITQGSLEKIDSGCTFTSNTGRRYNFNLNASNSNSIYGNSDTVQQDAYLVNIWERIS